jgi:molecular chaperone GrpE
LPKKKKEQENIPSGEEGASKELSAGESRGKEEVAAEAGEGLSLEEQLAARSEEAKKNWDLYLRERADLENFRKRAQRDKEDLARFANEKFLREILPVLDNLERAVGHARQNQGGGEGLLEGVEMTLNQLQRVLEKFGATPFESVGTAFDPSRHEAIGHVESAEHAPNMVAQELQKGYLLSDRLLRPAMVMVAKPAAEPKKEERG